MLETQAPELALGPSERQARSLVIALGEALERRHVMYCCQWKGNWKKRRWMSGEGDIDLLVERSTEPHFTAVLEALGFRRCTPPLEACAAVLPKASCGCPRSAWCSAATGATCCRESSSRSRRTRASSMRCSRRRSC